MKKLTLMLVGVVTIILLNACVLVSVAPFYIPTDTQFNPALLGSWVQTDDPDQQWKFEKEGNLAYKLTHTEQKNAPVISQAHLFKLRDQLFLDIGQHLEAPDDNAFPPRLPSHLLIRIYELKPMLRAGTMNYQWIVALLDKDPKALRHHVIKKGEKIEDRELVLTAPTEELQQFIIKHLSTEAAWNDFELKRVADSPKSK